MECMNPLYALHVGHITNSGTQKQTWKLLPMLHLIVFPGNKFSSLLDAKVARFVMQNSLGILPTIFAKHLRPDLLGLDVFLLQRSIS